MNQVALITGAAKRVGRAIAQRLAQAGFDIAFTYRTSEAEAQSLTDHLTQLGRRSLAIRADLSDPQAAATTITQSFQKQFSRLDVLVHNASAYTPTPWGTVTLESARQLMAIHYETPLLLTQALSPMLRDCSGHIISMIDLMVERPSPDFAAYNASKSALQALTLVLARALAPQVTVNGITPGVVAWPDNFPQEKKDRILPRIPLARAGTPQDVAALVHFLATDGSYITGQIIPLDGGRSIT